jgi:transposase
LLGISRELFARLYAHFKELDRQVAELERQIKAWHRDSVASRRLEAIPGIGPLSASALAYGARGRRRAAVDPTRRLNCQTEWH